MSGYPQDYYELLGVTRDADSATIKRAFRSRARELHPDVSELPDAQERFAELSRAYGILSKPASRILYDRYGYLGSRGAGWDSQRRRGGDSSAAGVAFAELRVAAVEAARGVTRRVDVGQLGRCRACAGTGAARGAAIHTCEACAGEGFIRSNSSLGNGRLLRVERCLTCAGRGAVADVPCRRCHGSGETREEQRLAVRIEGGTKDGEVIRVRTGAVEKGRDVFVRLRVMPERDPRLLRAVAIAALVVAITLFAVLVWNPHAILDTA